MGDWALEWNFGSASYRPGDSGRVDFWLDNTGDTYLYATEAGIQFEFQERQNIWHAAICSVQVPPRKRRHLSSLTFQIPQTLAGIVRYRVCYDLWEYNSYSHAWEDLGLQWGELNQYINVLPAPLYRAFLSRGLRPEDRLVGDEIAEMIREWGFETMTVGIEEFATTEMKEVVKDEIIKSDCLVALATPRYLDAVTGLWRTLEWLHGEVGIAYGTERPLLILVDDRVALGGLPGEFVDLSISFNAFDLEDLRKRLGALMPSWREWVATRRREDFLKKVLNIGAPLVVGGVVGLLIGRSKGPRQ